MSEKNVLFYDKVKNVWKEIAQNGTPQSSDFRMDIYNKMLALFHVGDYYYFIFDVKNGDFEYINENITPILGYDKTIRAVDFIENIHPDDQIYFINFEKKLNTFFKNLPFEKIDKYKIQYDFRIKNKEGIYKRILHQMMIIQYDHDNSLLRSLGIHTDISHIKSDGYPSLSFIGLENEPSYYNIPFSDQELVVASTPDPFSPREKEILRLVLSGKSSIEISGMLNISHHTVNTHRKNIFAKSQCSSLAELGSKSVKEGWI